MAHENTIIKHLDFTIIRKIEYYTLIPESGDIFTFHKTEDDADFIFRSYISTNRDNDNIEEKYLTDFFKLPEIEGTMSNPVYFGTKKYGFFGLRFNNDTRRFFLYNLD